MKRTLFLVVATAAVLAIPATASAFSGVAVAKDQARHSVVVASKSGVVRTVRAPGKLASIRLGHGVTYSARRLSDGTFRATSIRSTGVAHRAVLRGVVVRNQQRLRRVLLSAGGTIVSVRAPARGFASSHGPRAGDRVEVRVKIGANGLQATSMTTIGHSGTVELEGIFLGVTSETLRLAVEQRGEVFVAIPAGFQLPQLQPGDEIEAIVTVDAAGAFTLVSVQTDDENDGDHEGIGEDHGRIEVKGAITQLGDGTITVQSPGASPVSCAVPAGTDLSGFNVTDRVEMRCATVGGKLTLTRLRRDDDGDDGGHDGD
jgi:hypothetical protein